MLRNVERRYHETSSDYIREQMEKYMAQQACPKCKGNRLKRESLAVLIDEKHIGDTTRFSVKEAYDFLKVSVYLKRHEDCGYDTA